jgi:hypothetical protein
MIALRAASVGYVLPGLGFGIGALVTIRHLAEHGELPMTPWGFRAFDGPAVRLGPEAVTALLWLITAACAVDVAAGVGIWQRRRTAALVGVATTPVQLALGAGFLLPFLLAAIPLRLGSLAAGRRQLR